VTAAEPGRLIHGARAKALLALGCLAVLALGWLVAPRETARPVAETVAPMLETEVQRREPVRIFQGVREAALAALPFTAAFVGPSPARLPVADFAAAPVTPEAPAGFGLVTSDGEVLSHRDALGGRRTATAVLPAGERATGEVVAYEADSGLVLVRVVGLPRTGPPPLKTVPVVAGASVAAVGHIDGLEFVAPVFIAATRGDAYVLTGAGGTLLPGMPVVDLDGLTLAITAAGRAPVRAYAVAPALARLRALMAQGRALPRTIGVTLQALDSDLVSLLGTGGAVIAGVEPAGPAARAGLREADVLLAVGDRPVATLAAALDAVAALPADAPATLTVRRAAREATFTVVPQVTLENPRAGVEGPLGDGPRAADVFSREALRRARLPPDAVVLAVAGAPTSTAAQAAAALRRGRGPVLVRARQDGRPFLTVVEPAG